MSESQHTQDRYARIRAALAMEPTDPDDTMVICPVCTSQFRAIPLDVQLENEFLRKGVGDIARAALGKTATNTNEGESK